MNILIVTQVVDKEHPILGFFHRWIEEFATHCGHVHVICLQKGTYQFPDNVTVHSLGKEAAASRMQYVIRFYKMIWKLRGEYDGVFVHMNQVYVILGAPVWFLLRKKTGLWYMHGTVSRSLWLAEKLVQRVFTGSKESFRLKSSKVHITGHGIDTARFITQTEQKTMDLITVGRITQSKNLLQLLEVFLEIQKTHPVTLTIVGGAVTESEKRYEESLRSFVHDKALSSRVTFKGKVPQEQLPAVLRQAKVFVTVAQNGSLDKAILEAMACGVAVVSMAPGTASLPLGTNQTTDVQAFSKELERVIAAGMSSRPDYATYVAENHSLTSLIPKILKHYDA